MLPGGFTLAQSVFSLNIGSVTALSMYPTPINGRYLIAAGVNSGGQYYAYLLSWSPGGGLKTLWSVSEPENVESITVSPNYVVVGLGSSSGQGIINVYSTSGKELWSYTFTYGWTIVVNDVAISPNQQLIAATTGGPSGQPYGDLTVFNAITGNPIWSYTYGTSQFLGTREATFSPNGNYLLMIAGNGYASGGYVILFNAYNGQVIWDINNLADPWVASFSPDGQYIVVGAANSYAWGGHNHAYLISISGNVLWSYTTGPNAPNAWFDWVSTNYGATKTYVAGNGYLYLLNSAGSVIWQYPLGFGNSPIAESENGSIVAVAELGDNELLVFNSTGSPMTYTVPSQINNMAMSSDGSLVVLGTQSGVTVVSLLSYFTSANSKSIPVIMLNGYNQYFQPSNCWWNSPTTDFSVIGFVYIENTNPVNPEDLWYSAYCGEAQVIIYDNSVTFSVKLNNGNWYSTYVNITQPGWYIISAVYINDEKATLFVKQWGSNTILSSSVTLPPGYELWQPACGFPAIGAYTCGWTRNYFSGAIYYFAFYTQAISNGAMDYILNNPLSISDLPNYGLVTLYLASSYIQQSGVWVDTVGGNNAQGANGPALTYLSITPAAPTYYNVIFTETGLPGGLQWSVTLNGTTETTTSNQLVFKVAGGNYEYSINVPSGYVVTPQSGTLTVTANTTLSITVTPMTYSVTFVESGLPQDTQWIVYLNGHEESSTSNEIVFNEPNGYYQFTISSVSGYVPTPSGGNVTVNNGNVIITVYFTQAPNYQPQPKQTTSTFTPALTLNDLIIAIVILLIIILIIEVLRLRKR